MNSNINDKILSKENDENLNKSKETISISNIRSDKSVDNIKNNRMKKNKYEIKKN